MNREVELGEFDSKIIGEAVGSVQKNVIKHFIKAKNTTLTVLQCFNNLSFITLLATSNFITSSDAERIVSEWQYGIHDGETATSHCKLMIREFHEVRAVAKC